MTFDRALDFVLDPDVEGVLSNDPLDPGKLTKYGISSAAYPGEDIANLTRAQAGAILKRDYWDKLHCDQLPHGLDLLVFDCAVNQGQPRAALMLQSILSVKCDGVIGPDTMQRLRGQSATRLIVEYAAARMQNYGNNPLFQHDGRGWSRRLMRAVYLALGAGQ